MELLDGKLLSEKIKDEIKIDADQYKVTPILAVITIGYDKPSEIYVKNKRKMCEYAGISMMHFDYVDFVKESVVIRKIKELNKDKNVTGIIVQLPLPKGYDERKIINTINPLKDVDGLSDISLGKLMSGSGDLIPCTAKGIIELLDYYKIEIEHKNVVIVGRSNLVGKPVASLLLNRNATVTICHSKTKNLKEYTSLADILIVSVGKKHLIDKTMIKKGSVIVDVGINREDGIIYGDVNPNVSEVCSYLTPVPGGIGPMTVCMLLKNIMIAYKKQNNY